MCYHLKYIKMKDINNQLLNLTKKAEHKYPQTTSYCVKSVK